MAKGINKVILVGHLGKDPEVRATADGRAIANLSIATSEKWKDKQTGQPVEKTEWHRVVLYQRVAEIARDYLSKGSLVYIEGRLQTRKWNDNGIDKFITEIICTDMQMLGGNKNAQPQQQGQYQQNNYAPQQQAHGNNGVNRVQQNQSHNYQPNSPVNDSIPFDDDEIPF